MKCHFIAAHIPKAQELLHILLKAQTLYSPQEADVIVVLGGDGFMLRCLHDFQKYATPFYGINCGTVGFLLNTSCAPSELTERIGNAHMSCLRPLTMSAYNDTGIHTHHAVNEVSLLRMTHQAGMMDLFINDEKQLSPLIGDGLIVSTPAGSTAYNRSAGGPIIPLGTPLLALTPLCAFQPRDWRGALLDEHARIRIDIQRPEHRCMSACADDTTITNVHRVDVHLSQDVLYEVLFDPDHNLETRIVREQFHQPRFQ